MSSTRRRSPEYEAAALRYAEHDPAVGTTLPCARRNSRFADALASHRFPTACCTRSRRTLFSLLPSCIVAASPGTGRGASRNPNPASLDSFVNAKTRRRVGDLAFHDRWFGGRGARSGSRWCKHAERETAGLQSYRREHAVEALHAGAQHREDRTLRSRMKAEQPTTGREVSESATQRELTGG